MKRALTDQTIDGYKNKMRAFFKILILLIVLAACVLVSCAPDQEYQRVINNAYYGKGRSSLLNSELVSRAMTQGALDSAMDYRLGPEDLLQISVFRVDDLSATVRISEAGMISLPLVNGVKAAGLTPPELEKIIAGKLRAYIQDPIVNVFVKEYRSRKITVVGAVRNPQVFTISGQKYLLDMLSMAGGLTDEASNVCFISRRAGPDGSAKEKTLKIDLNELLEKGDTELNIPVRSGDVINIPPAGRFFVDGAVGAPGSYMLTGNITLTQAISMARGLNFEALKHIKIYRNAGGGQRKLLVANYDSILGGKSPDIYIKDNDVIIVPASVIKGFFKDFRSSVYTHSISVGRGY